MPVKAKTEKQRTDHLSNIQIVGHGKGLNQERFVMLLITDGARSRRILLRTDNWAETKGEHFTRLNQAGAHLISGAAKRAFTNLLQDTSPSGPVFRVATRCGLVGGNFVLPDIVIPVGKRSVEAYLDDYPRDILAKFRCAGDLTGWYELVSCSRDNSRFILGLCQGFTGIVAAISNNETATLQYTGPAGTAKSSLAAVISCIWGHRTSLGDKFGFGESWSHTLNNLEPVLAAHNDTLLFLDETRNTGAEKKQEKQVLDAAMKIDGGIEKGRLTQPGPNKTWRVPVISTSNLSVVDLLAATKQEFDAAYADRLIDIPPPEGGAGMFETLHGHANVAEFVQRLKRIAGKHYGVVGREFADLVLLYRKNAKHELRVWIEKRRQAYIRQAEALVAPGRDLVRLHGRFATIHAAGCLAAAFGLLDLTRQEISEAILKCESDHVSYIASKIAEGTKLPALALLNDYVRTNKANFVDLRKGVPELNSGSRAHPPGYLAEKAGEQYYLFPSALLDTVVGGPQRALALKHDLHRNKDIRITGAGNAETRFAVKWAVATKKGKPVRSYVNAIKRSALAIPRSVA